MNINIDVILADLKNGKVPRTQKSLNKSNNFHQNYFVYLNCIGQEPKIEISDEFNRA